MRIAILSNCQTPLWSNSIKAMMPSATVVLARHVGVTTLTDDVISAADGSSDVILVVADWKPRLLEEMSSASFSADVVAIPPIHFPAFHPDGCYLSVNGIIEPTRWGTHWSPRLAAWAFLEGLDVNEALALYCDDAFEEVGYHAAWNVSVASLRAGFDDSGFDFDQWLWPVKRSGVFMHGFNHPKPIAVAALAHQLCRVRFDTTLPPLEELVGVLPDPLASGVIWPVHRPIALRLGVPATNVVKVNDTYVQWEDFVHGCYKGWALNGLTSETATTSAPVSPSSRHTLLTLAGRSTS